jgi:2-methylcitrate dehydratase PrpD
MPLAVQSHAPPKGGRPTPHTASAAARLASFAVDLPVTALPPDVILKAKLALLDFFACAIEARDLPWSRQAVAVASDPASGGAPIIATPMRAHPAQAAFANATMGHGLIREDMHPGSTSHLGVVVWPTLLALAGRRQASGADLLAGAVAGYEVGARIGRTLFDADLATRFRPTGVTGPIGAAAGAARLLRLGHEQGTAAIALAANTTAGLNDWPWTGGTEVFFHAGNAARNAVTAAMLADEGLLASPTALDGKAGLYAAFGREHRIAGLFAELGDDFEILNIYFKPAPACNYVQTACQAALALAREGVQARDIGAVEVLTFPAAVNYPGCDWSGPFDRLIQAKMSIQFSVAATLARGAVEEANYRRLDDPQVLRLAAATTLKIDPQFEANFPSRQGAELIVTLTDGTRRRHRLTDLTPCPPDGVRARFRAAAEPVLGRERSGELEAFVDKLDKAPDLAPFDRLVGAQAAKAS